MADIAVHNMLVQQMETWLRQKLATEQTTLVVQNIRAGRLQEDPTVAGLNILISEDATQARYQATPSTDGTLGAYAHEIGGGAFFFTNFELDLIFHFSGENDRAVARSNAYIVIARLKRALIDMPMPTHPETGSIRDDFGEGAIALEIVSLELRESGGPGSFIWKGKLQIRVLSEQIE